MRCMKNKFISHAKEILNKFYFYNCECQYVHRLVCANVTLHFLLSISKSFVNTDLSVFQYKITLVIWFCGASTFSNLLSKFFESLPPPRKGFSESALSG